MTSVKTGLPPQFGGAEGSRDLKDIIPAIGSSVGIDDIGKAVEFFKKHRGLIGAILGLFGIGKPKAPKPSPLPPPTEPPPSPGLPPKDSAPGTPPSTPAPGGVRIPTGLRSAWFLIERKNRPGEYGGGRHILGKDDFDAITNGDGWARLGDRLHVNTTPYDAQGDFQPDNPDGRSDNRGLLVDPNDPAGENGKSRIVHHIFGNGELTSEYDDYGCTPVVLIPWEDGDGPIKNDTDVVSEVSYQAEYRGPNGERVMGNRIGPIRIKA